MVYKNGIREYTLSTLLFGVPMGLFFGLINRSALIGAVSGIFSGCFFLYCSFYLLRYKKKSMIKCVLKLPRREGLFAMALQLFRAMEDGCFLQS